jgi:hypothetical protein
MSGVILMQGAVEACRTSIETNRGKPSQDRHGWRIPLDETVSLHPPLHAHRRGRLRLCPMAPDGPPATAFGYG